VIKVYILCSPFDNKMGTYTGTWTVDIRRLEVFEDWSVDIRRTSMDSPIVNVDGVPHANIAAIKGVPSANIRYINGVRMKDYRWQVIITA